MFWIGIGHAGTLISAILFLFRQKWRTSINRAAEAMTLFAVMCAGIFPGSTSGAFGWRGFWRRFPNPMHLAELPQSADLGRVRGLDLFHGVRAVLVSPAWFRIWRRCAIAPPRKIKTVPSTGRFRAGLARIGPALAPLRTGVSDSGGHLDAAGALGALVVSFDFATSVIPGWHTTIFPPYFVAGASSPGSPCVMTLLMPARWTLNLQD